MSGRLCQNLCRGVPKVPFEKVLRLSLDRRLCCMPHNATRTRHNDRQTLHFFVGEGQLCQGQAQYGLKGDNIDQLSWPQSNGTSLVSVGYRRSCSNKG